MTARPGRILLALALAAGACSGDAGAGEDAAAPVVATSGYRYLANMGVVIEGGATDVAIDALFGDGLAEYHAVPPAVRSRLEAGEPPFDDVRLVLVTHVHADHFDAGAVSRFLDASPWAVLLAPAQAVDTLAAKTPGFERFAGRVRGVTPPPGGSETLDVAGTRVRAIRLVHPPSRNEPVELVGWVVDVAGRRWVHVGDVGTRIHGLADHDLAGGDVDLAFVPFWLLTDEEGRRLVDERIDPERVVGLHVGRDGDAAAIARRAGEGVVVHGAPPAGP